jgi:hypothetical protein
MDLRPALEDAIRTLRAENPLLPVAVVVPQHLFGVRLGRSIFRDTGHMAIEFVLPHEHPYELGVGQEELKAWLETVAQVVASAGTRDARRREAE